ncbi:MAG: CDP-alcohol phosphatidyltransferase family protein [Lachnospiraceae bacterium]|nr:CDP-alcohol phosphatidyltransferase family protein [Lachnospiraceae bacterium]
MPENGRKPIGFYDYTVILTYCGMMFGFVGVLLALQQQFWKTMICLMIAGGCDMFDGLVASTKERSKQEKRFGIQIDSMSDLINFGVLPAIFVYEISKKNMVISVICSLYVLSALIRLAYYNVSEEERQDTESGSRKVFLGLPVTTAALLFPLLFLLFDMGIFRNILNYPMALILLGILFLAPVEIKKPGMTGKIIIIVIGLAEVFGMIMFKG